MGIKFTIDISNEKVYNIGQLEEEYNELYN